MPHASTARPPSEVTAGKPKMPKTLTPAAKKEWRRILPLLMERGSLSKADSTALALYCETFARWQEAQQELSTHGLVVITTVHDKHGTAVTVRKANPALKIAENAERSLRAFLREFGMTPGSREKITPAKKSEDGDGGSIMEFLEKQR